jgi:AAA+ ATPase superfamily predicted ATPase
MGTLVGRAVEKSILAQKLSSPQSELIAIYGRRRVGKTYLVRNFCASMMVFEMTGIHNATLKDQLQNFSLALQKAIATPIPPFIPENWLQAFDFLDRFLLDTLADKTPKVIFFDEFPWIHTRKSNFLQAFDHWWNSSASKKSNIKVIICGSAASWMIDKIVNNRGGLHNRVTQTIRLLPFTLNETEEFLKSKGVVLDRYQVLQIYMAMGGVPYYLQNILPGESAAQIIDKLCFTKDGALVNEFDNLYKSLFASAEQHEKIIRALANKNRGLNRQEIIDECGFSTGGGTTQILKELEESGFITPYIPFAKTENEKIYKLTDEYSFFYQKFIEKNRAKGAGTWLRQSTTTSYLSWSGFAFESVCQKHVLQIKKALGIEGVLTQVSSWRYRPEKGNNSGGAQIDLMLDRQDRCINICEIKFATDEFKIDKKYAGEIDHKVNTFRRESKTKKTLFLTMITTYGTKQDVNYIGRIQSEVKMNDLFL